MKIQNRPNNLPQSYLVHLHGNDWLEKQRVAGQVHAEIMTLLEHLIESRTNLSLLEIDKLAGDEIAKRGCLATFNDYRGFPANLCISVNKQLVHGIPTDYHLEDGDVVTFDFGITYQGAIADAAKTMIFGPPKKQWHLNIITAARKCLYNSIKALKPEEKTGAIGYSIHKTAKNAGFNVIESLGGHSLSWDSPHAFLFISNKSSREDGVRIQPGLTLAVEPLLVPGNCSTKTKLSNDGWTIYTDDISCHVEETIYVHPDKIEIITWRESEKDLIPKFLPFN